jgi:hypothetical protein
MNKRLEAMLVAKLGIEARNEGGIVRVTAHAMGAKSDSAPK